MFWEYRMKIAYAATYMVTLAVLIFFQVRTQQNKSRLSRYIRYIFLDVTFATVFHHVVVMSNHETLSLVFYGFYYITLDWVLIRILQFTLDFTRYGNFASRVILVFLRVYACLDSVILETNFFTKVVFTLKKGTLENGDLYFAPEFTPVFLVHLLLCYIVTALVVLTLIQKACNVPSAYLTKYLLVLFSLLILVIWDGIFLIGFTKVNLSVIGYTISSITLYYYSIWYIPAPVRSRIVFEIMQSLDRGVLFMDEVHRCIYANDQAKVLFGSDTPDDLYDLACTRFSLEQDGEVPTEDYSVDRTYPEKDGIHHYRVDYRILRDSKDRLVGALYTFTDRTEEVKQLEEQRYLASHDQLTGIYNAVRFYERVEQILKEHPDEEYVIICSYLRRFQLVNDIFGSEVRDQVLKRLAVEFQKVGEDLGEQTVYGRISDNRFGMFVRKALWDESGLDQTPPYPVQVVPDRDFYLTLVFGVYVIDDRETPVRIMLDRTAFAADELADVSKSAFAYYDTTIREKALEEQSITSELDQALAEGQIVMYLQPQVNEDGKVHGAEVLTRWIHPKRGFLPPYQFIPTFEKNGSITKMDRYIWEQACKKLAEWTSRGFTDRYLSVNISAVDILLTDVYEEMTKLVEKYAVNPHNLHLEITETAITQDLKGLLKLIERFHNYGFIMEMDDFGSGYSSLNMLKDIPIDVLKIDMAFLRDETQKSRKILTSIVKLSQTLDLPVIMEGVETQEQYEFLVEQRPDIILQGYYFSKPLPVAEYEEKYLNS